MKEQENFLKGFGETYKRKEIQNLYQRTKKALQIK